MKFDETTNKWIPENEDEQKFFDYAFNKGVGQGKKTAPKVEEPKTESLAFDPEVIAKMVADTVGAAVKPLYDGFNNIQATTKAAMKDKVIARQQTKLPKAYEALVDGNTEAEIKASFDSVVEQFKSEFKDAGVNFSFGAPTPGADTAGNKPAKAFKDMTREEKVSLYKEDPEMYSKLSSGK